MTDRNKAKYINELWREFRAAVNTADADGVKQNSADGHAECNALRDYRDPAYIDKMGILLEREIKNERKHKYGPNLNVRAKLLIMSWASWGAQHETMPAATLFLTGNPSAAEAQVIGYLARKALHPAWRAAVNAIDYSQLAA